MKRKEILKELKKFHFKEAEASMIMTIAIEMELFASALARNYAKKRIDPKKYVSYKEEVFKAINDFKSNIASIKTKYGVER